MQRFVHGNSPDDSECVEPRHVSWPQVESRISPARKSDRMNQRSRSLRCRQSIDRPFTGHSDYVDYAHGISFTQCCWVNQRRILTTHTAMRTSYWLRPCYSNTWEWDCTIAIDAPNHTSLPYEANTFDMTVTF